MTVLSLRLQRSQPSLLGWRVALCRAAAHGAEGEARHQSMGDIVVELDAAKAPKTVDNFVQYVKAGHYDGTDLPPRDRQAS